jgi:glycosyltransferase 2 family protein
MADRLKRAASYLLAAAALAWVLHDVHPGDLVQHLVVQHPAWLLLAVMADILSYLTQGVRWRLFLMPIGNLSTRKTVQAIYAGLFVNEVAPMRLGEAVRAYLAARWLSVRFTSILPSIAFERLADGVWLAAGAGLTALFVPLPDGMVRAAEILGIVLSVAITLLLLLVLFGPYTRLRRIDRAAQAMHAAGAAPEFWFAFLTSSLILILQTMAFWFAMKAYDLPFNFWVGTAVFLIVHLGTAIPNAPANVGLFQFFVVAGLTFFGLDKTTAAGFSVAVFLILTIPLWLIGFLALGRTGLTLAHVRLGIGKLASIEAEAP